MKIKSIKVDNFKSLVGFELPLSKFSCLVGLNGSGKSTVLQFFDFLSQQVRGDLSGWLKKRQWEASDLNSKLTRKQNIDFEVLLSHPDYGAFEIKWSASFNRKTLHCTSERIEWNNQLLLKVDNGNYQAWTLQKGEEKIFPYNDDTVLRVSSIGRREILSGSSFPKRQEILPGSREIAFAYQGSIMSQIKDSLLPKEIRQLKNFFFNLHALDLLAPELLRQRTRDADNSLGLGGEKLSAFLHGLGEEKRSELQTKLVKIYPQFKQFDLSSLPSGWKKLTVQEQFGDTIIKTEASHVADGFLRILAVLAQLSKYQSFLLLDEIENGVNPELIEFLIDELVGASPQVLITTHSPMVLNYLEDDIAIEGVIYIYKAKNGATQAIRLFDIPSMREKLTVMGAGEVYEDTLLTQLNEEIIRNLQCS
jgi:predicted ATPase